MKKYIRNYNLKIIVALFCVFALLLLALIKVIIPSIKYNAAIKLFNSNDYSASASIFNSIDYRDSADKAKESFYFIQKEKIKYIKRDDIIKFGLYEQDNNELNGMEEIEWRVLYVDGNKALIISEYGLDCMQYNNARSSVTWESCTLRTWLNDTFLNTAFSTNHQEMIELITVSADMTSHYDPDPEKDTSDKVFLLSIPEANKYFYNNSYRICVPTKYAISKGTFTTRAGSPGCYWWLRSTGHGNERAATVNDKGFVDTYGEYVNADTSIRDFYGYAPFDHNVCVRPAMWISL